jgi:mannose-6-phosphate isomerase-like protein (cupin superfamily)
MARISAAENERAVLGFRREALAEGVQLARVALRRGESSLFHHHTRTRDTFYVLSGELVVTLRVAVGSSGYHLLSAERREMPGLNGPVTRVVLGCGDVLVVEPGVVHCAANLAETPCEFLCIEGPGEYDFVQEDAPDSPPSTESGRSGRT